MSLIYEFLVLVYMGIKTKYLISIDDVINSSKANNSILHYNKIFPKTKKDLVVLSRQ